MHSLGALHYETKRFLRIGNFEEGRLVDAEIWRGTAIRVQLESACSMLIARLRQMRVRHACCYAEI